MLLLLPLFRAQRRALRALATMMATHLHGVLLEEEEKEEVTRKRKRARRGTKRRGKLKVICKKTRQFFDLSSFSSFHPLSLSHTLSLSLSLSLLSLSLLFFPVSPSSNRHPAAAQRPRDRIQKRVVSRQRQQRPPHGVPRGGGNVRRRRDELLLLLQGRHHRARLMRRGSGPARPRQQRLQAPSPGPSSSRGGPRSGHGGRGLRRRGEPG